MPSTNNVPVRPTIDAAITEAAFQTLLSMYPKQEKIFIAVRNAYLTRIPSDIIKQDAINKGIFIGRFIADSILKNRINDGSQINQTYIPSFQLGYHQVDPTHPKQGFLGVHWGQYQTIFIKF